MPGISEIKEVFADLIETYLKNEDYSVFKFYSAKEALECIQTTVFDLAVLDVMMPEIDGLTLCKRIRDNYTYPIIMLTAKDGETDRITGLTHGTCIEYKNIRMFFK